jgi:hypothetical protein
VGTPFRTSRLVLKPDAVSRNADGALDEGLPQPERMTEHDHIAALHVAAGQHVFRSTPSSRASSWMLSSAFIFSTAPCLNSLL